MIKKINETRKQLGISQHRLSKLAKVSRYKLTCAECDYLILTEDELKRINAALNAFSRNKSSNEAINRLSCDQIGHINDI